MKTIRIILLLCLALFIAGKASSQMSIIIFSEKGEKFTAYVNGAPRNGKPVNRVETDRPGGPSFKLRITFEDSSIPEITKTVFNSIGSDMYYVIQKSDKGKYILEKTSYEYVHNADNAAAKTETTTVTAEKTTTETAKTETKPAGGSGKGCSGPMEEGNFIASREMISNAPFDGPKLTQAKNLADKNCLTTSQIIDVIYIFSGESSKLNFAKYAYKHCFDPNNYDRVKDVLHTSSQEDLQKYIESLK